MRGFSLMRRSGVLLALMIWVYGGDAMGQRLDYSEAADPMSLSPLNTKFAVDARFSDLIFNRLIGFDEFQRPKAELLESLDPVEVSEDSLSYTFQLKKKVMWHRFKKRGQTFPEKELTADDVVFTYEVLKDSRTDTDKKSIIEVFRDVLPVGRYKVQFRLNRSVGDVRNYFFFPILPRHVFPPNTKFLSSLDDFGRRFVVGTGPYVFRGWSLSKSIALRWNKRYFKEWPELIDESFRRIEDIEMHVNRDQNSAKESLLEGGLDLIPLVVPTHYPELRNNVDINIFPYNPRSVMYLAYNNKHKFFKIKKVRQALTFATGRKRMWEHIYGAALAEEIELNILSGPFPKGEGDPDIAPREYDPERARSLLRSAGFSYTKKDSTAYFTEGGIKEKFSITLKAFGQYEDTRRICEYYQDDLSKVGVEVKLNFIPKERLKIEVLEKKRFDVALLVYSFGPGQDIVEDLFSQAAMRPGRNNITSYTSPQIEALLQENRLTGDPEVKEENKRKMHRILFEDCPGTFLFSMDSVAAYRNDKLGGVEIHPFNFFAYITDWYYIEEY